MTKISGTGVAIVTPFHFSGEVDYEGLTNLLEHIISNGVDFVVAMGTTSEAVTLKHNEKQEVFAHVKKVVKKRVPIVLGIGGNNTQAVVNELSSTDLEDVSAILSVAPYYNKPNQRGIYEHFKAISENCPVPIILYNVPGRTSSNINSETVVKLATEFKNIVAIKEASGDFGQIMDIIKNKPEGFNVLSGDDALTFPMVSLGAKGVISVVANLFPKQFSEMVNYSLIGDLVKAREIHYNLIDVINLLFADGNPAGVKAGLEIIGILSNNLRLPMVPVNHDLYVKLAKSIEEVKSR